MCPRHPRYLGNARTMSPPGGQVRSTHGTNQAPARHGKSGLVKHLNEAFSKKASFEDSRQHPESPRETSNEAQIMLFSTNHRLFDCFIGGIKMITKMSVLAIVLLSISPTSAIAEDFERIKTKADFDRTLVGRKGSASWGWVTSRPDGTIVGAVNGESATGSWEWKNGFWCRTISWGESKQPYDCQAVFHKGNTAVFIRNRGQGEQTVVHMQ